MYVNIKNDLGLLYYMYLILVVGSIVYVWRIIEV